MNVEKALSEAHLDYKEHKQFFEKLKRKKPGDLDDVVQEIHEEVFEYTNCMKCANCCKTTSPIFSDRDVDRIAKHLKIKPSELIEKHLHLAEDNDYVLNIAPCTFLDEDNSCTIYEHRPTACREYPHTNRKRFYQLMDLTLRNTLICPAAAEITGKLKSYYK